jgi:RHS repeat-associated protein
VDENADVVSCEEYNPYGTTAYWAGRSAAEISLKRYRYTGKEKDDENGLSYHGARYYACWLGRWTACDPIGLHESANFYQYARNNPILLADEDGMAPKEKNVKVKKATKKIVKTLGENLPDAGPGGGGSNPDNSGYYEPFKRDENTKNQERIADEDKRKKQRRRDPDKSTVDKKAVESSDSRFTSNPDSAGKVDGPTHYDRQTVHDSGELQIHEGDVNGRRGTNLVEVPDIESKPKRVATIPIPDGTARKGKEIVSEELVSKLGKVIGEGAAKVAPVISIGAGIGFGLKAFEEGRYLEGALDFAGLAPVIGEIVDIGVTAYEIGSVLEETFDISDAFIPFTDEVEALPEAYKKKVKRGSPGFLKPKKRATPPKRPPVQKKRPVIKDEPMRIQPGLVGPKRLIDYPIS